MRLSLLTFVRPAVFVLAGLTAVAIVLGRGAPRATEVRRSEPVRYHAINWYLFRQADPAPRFLDAETGRLARVAFSGSGSLEYASCSPWRDDRGQAQLVGLWNETSGRGGESVGLGLGLARYTFPGRQLLDRVPIDVIPGSVPCWYPGTSPMVLFSATNGRLYRFTFAETRKGEDDAGRGGNRPSPLVWQCTPPGGGDVRIGDPTWPTDPRLCGRIVVSLRTWEGADPEHGFSRPRLWWLQLSRDGTKIEGAGRLTRPDPDADERWPALASDPDGNLTLAFMERRDGRPGWRLRLAPVAIHRETGVPRAARPIGVSQDEACLPVPPVFSTDGRWVHTLSGAEQSLARVDRCSVSEILADGAERPEPTHLADIHAPGDGSTLPR